MPIVTLLGGWRNVAIAAAAAVALLYVGWLKWTISDLEADLATVQASLAISESNVEIARNVNVGNLAALDHLEADRDAADRASAGALVDANRRCSLSVRIQKEVTRVATEQPATCGVAPSVRAALDELRATAASADRDGDRARGGGPAGVPADVPR